MSYIHSQIGRVEGLESASREFAGLGVARHKKNASQRLANWPAIGHAPVVNAA
jgi:hypothetical protein